MGKRPSVRWVLVAALAWLAGLGAARARAEPAAAELRYQSPRAGAAHVMAATALALRLDGPLNPDSVRAELWEVSGTLSGAHLGQARLARDGRTVSFAPQAPFAPGEMVTVRLRPGLETQAGAVFAGLEYTFTVSAAQTGFARAALDGLRAQREAAEAAARPSTAGAASAAGAAQVFNPLDFATIPDHVAPYTVTVPASGTVAGYYFFGSRVLSFAAPVFLFIADQAGEPVYWRELPSSHVGNDFKRQPDGRLSYFRQADRTYPLLDDTYTEVRAIAAGNGYLADGHELQITPNGEALLMIYDPQPVDMSQVITGGVPTATVFGLVVQAIDLDDAVVFEWRSWDDFLITDTTVPLTTPVIDYVHGNAIELDTDGNLLISSRHLDEITKLDRDTGAVLWRWGGLRNEFTFSNDPHGGFYHQHDIRRQPDGTLTLFDNHMTTHNVAPLFSRAVAYSVDEISKTATLEWEYRNTPDTSAPAMGSHQRLDDGHVLVGWGTGSPAFTEVWAADGSMRFEVLLEPPRRTYRAFRLPWAAQPAWPPSLVLTDTLAGEPRLYFSWNGATEVGSYEIWGGVGAAPEVLLGVQPRTGFEDQAALGALPYTRLGACAFRVRALDGEGQPLAFSNVVYVREPCLSWDQWLPAILQPVGAAARLLMQP